MEKDWDNLIILDGCRYDLFESEIGGNRSLKGELTKRITLGTCSPSFVQKNFQGGSFLDTVYVTANPFVMKELEAPFHHVEHVWLTSWDEEEETVHPETMVREARRMAKEYPRKRLILHFMQPHHPFIGETRLEEDGGYNEARAKALGDSINEEKHVWELLRDGDIDRDKAWAAYRDNLRLALSWVENLLDDLEGKTVITSDHGNAFGEPATPFPVPVYGHAPGVRIPELINVPWHQINYDSRKQVVAADEEPDQTPTEQAVIADRLEDLGYK